MANPPGIDYTYYNYPTDFAKESLDLLVAAEGAFVPRAMDIGDGTLTLGYGYTLIRGGSAFPDINSDFAAAGIAPLLTNAEIADLNNGKQSDFLASWATSVTESQSRALAKIELARIDAGMLTTISRISQKYPSATAGGLNATQIWNNLQNTQELVALEVMQYVSPTLLDKNLVAALSQDNRAEAWFEIRYGWANNNVKFNNGWAVRAAAEEPAGR